MENIKMPYLPEETLRTQRVEIYLNDLKERLKELRLQHDEVIQNSVDIIKEIDEVSSSLLLPQTSVQQSDKITKIKKLIQDFETSKPTHTAKKQKTPASKCAVDGKVDIRKILHNFEKLNESHVLEDSLQLFKRAKESFEKIDTFFGKMSNATTTAGAATATPTATTAEERLSSIVAGAVVGNSLRNKINMFNAGPKDYIDAHSRYASCCSSQMSIDTFHSTEELGQLTNLRTGTGNNNSGKGVNSPPTNSLENGYEGDNDDSEYDLFAVKKKRSKCLPPTNV